MTTPPWRGRVDGPGPQDRRMHQHVQVPQEVTCADPDAIALMGFCCDAGVRRNQGRAGAAEGPAALRTALGPLALHRDIPVHDLGNVIVTGDELETGQESLGRRVADALCSHGLAIVLGGGHETAWGSYLGRTAVANIVSQRIGVVNLDAHFDLRQAAQASSGTPFRQMAEADERAGRRFRYLVAGISRASNTRTLFRTAHDLEAQVVLDVDCQSRHLEALLERLDDFLSEIDLVHLSIDLDVLPAAVAPGVSAPAALGIPMEVADAVCAHIAASGRLVLVDVVELCPPLDQDSRTARAAARLVHTIIERWSPPDCRSHPVPARQPNQEQA